MGTVERNCCWYNQHHVLLSVPANYAKTKCPNKTNFFLHMCICACACVYMDVYCIYILFEVRKKDLAIYVKYNLQITYIRSSKMYPCKTLIRMMFKSFDIIYNCVLWKVHLLKRRKIQSLTLVRCKATQVCII